MKLSFITEPTNTQIAGRQTPYSVCMHWFFVHVPKGALSKSEWHTFQFGSNRLDEKYEFSETFYGFLTFEEAMDYLMSLCKKNYKVCDCDDDVLICGVAEAELAMRLGGDIIHCRPKGAVLIDKNLCQVAFEFHKGARPFNPFDI